MAVISLTMKTHIGAEKLVSVFWLSHSVDDVVVLGEKLLAEVFDVGTFLHGHL